MTTESATKSSRLPGGNVINQPVVSITLSVLLTVVLKLLIERGWPHLTGLWHDWSRTVIGTVVISVIGAILFVFRKRFQAIYGLSEVGFAFFVISINLAKAQRQGDATSRIAVVGGAYLIVRGLTNYYEGKKKETT